MNRTIFGYILKNFRICTMVFEAVMSLDGIFRIKMNENVARSMFFSRISEMKGLFRIVSLLYIYLKSSIQPPGAYLISDTPEGGLIREGGSFTKSYDKDIYDSFSVLLPHILCIQHTILRVKYVNSTRSPYQTPSKLACNLV